MLITYIIVAIFLDIMILINASDNWLNYLYYQILQKTNPYQISIFVDKSSKTFQMQNTIIQSLCSETKCVITDIDTLQYENKNGIISSPVLLCQKKVSVYMVLSDMIKEKLHFLIDKFANISSYFIRPKCLIVLFDGNSSVENDIYEIQKYAWTKKFLDFTFIKINEIEQHIYVHNPFFNLFKKDKFYNDTNIFPGKIQNFNGYALKILVFKNIPYIDYTKHENGTIIAEGFFMPLLRLISESVNSTLKFVEVGHNASFIDYWTASISMINSGNISLTTYPNSISLYTGYLQHMAEMPQGCKKFVAIVPIQSTTKINIPFEIFMNGIIVFVTTITAIWIMKMLKIATSVWKSHEILRILLGTASPVRPQLLRDRIIFLSIFWLYNFFTTGIFTDFLNANVVETHESFNSFKGIYLSNLEAFMSRPMYKIIETNQNHYVKKLLSRVQIIKSTMKCIDKLKIHRNVICLSVSVEAEEIVHVHGIVNGIPIMKIANPVFACERTAFFFENSSPFVEIFNNVLQKVHEANLWRPLEYENHFKKKVNYVDNNSQEIRLKNCSGQLLLILSIGQIVSFTVFLIEVVFKQCNNSLCNLFQ